MEFNSKKFQAIRFAEILSEAFYTNDVEETIKQSNLVKFDEHVRIVANRGKRTGGWIGRVFSTRSAGVMLTLLKQLIYPTVEYNSVLWSPSDPELIDLLESVQRNFLRKIESPNLRDGCDYWDRLELFKLYSMERRRERYAIFYVWKVVHNIYPNPGLDLNNTTTDHNILPNQGIQISVNPRLGLKTQHDTNAPTWLEGKSVLARCCALYNCLPPKLRQPIKADKEPSFPDFKEGVDEWLSSIPDQPNCSGRSRLGKTNSILDQCAYRQRK